MRSLTDKEKVERLMRLLGRRSRGPGRVYFAGGTTAVLYGWRATTKDVDLKLDPEAPGIFEAIRDAKRELDLNIELAAPDDFVPPLPGHQERAIFIARHGEVDFFHYDPYGQALSKIERGHTQDLADVRALHRAGLIDADRLEALYDQIEDRLLRYPALDPATLAAKVTEAATDLRTEHP